MKRKANVGVMKQSKSAGDIRQEIREIKADFRCFQSRLGTRSLSHDSIFLSEQRQSVPEPPIAHSQENVHGKIQALQIKLQMQKLHLGPPPLVLPIKQTEDHQHPTEVQTISKNLPHKAQLMPSQRVLPHPISPALPPLNSSATSPGVDFSTLPQFIPCLDNSAARHRMSIKPRNQRASTKSKRIPTSDGSRPRSENMIILERALTENKEDDALAGIKEMTRVRTYSSQIIRQEKGLSAPPVKGPCPASPLKSLGGAADHHAHAISQCKGKEEPAVGTTAHTGTKVILKVAEGMITKRPSSAGPTSHKWTREHEDSLYSSKLKGVEGHVSILSSVYTPHPILVGTEQSQSKTDKESSTVTSHVKRNAQNKVQDTMEEHYPQDQPVKLLSLHRNTSPLDNKCEGINVHISSIPLPGEEGCLQETTTQQRSLSFSVSSDKNHDRLRTGSFTGQMEQAGGKTEHVFSLIKPSSNFKTQDLHKNAQVRATEKDPSQTGAISTTAVSTKPRDLTTAVSARHERGDSPATKYIALETQEGVEEANEANKQLTINKGKKEMHTKSQSEVNVKQSNAEVRSLSTPWLPESTTPTAVGQNDCKEGPVRETFPILRSPPLYHTELFVSAECSGSSSTQPQNASRDQRRTGILRLPDLQASAESPGSPNITMSMPMHVIEKSSLQTSAKESKEAFTELSWMTMAREKTRSLQQLFTNTLNDLAGLQTATRPAASPITQISLQPSTGPTRSKYYTSSAQPSVSPLETQLPTVYASVRATHPIQPPTLKSSISPAKPPTEQSRSDFSLKQTLSPTSQVQAHITASPGQMTTHSATKPVQLTGICISPTQVSPQVAHAAQTHLSQMPIYQAHLNQQSLPKSVTKPQASQSLRLSLSPKLTPHQRAHQSPSPVLQHRPFGENLSSLPLGKLDSTSMSLGKSPAETQAQYAVGLGSKALLTEQWHHQNPDALKVLDQKSTPVSQTCQSLDDFLTISSRSRFTELAVSPRPMRLDREVRCQRKTLPPSSSSLLQSNSDSRQPSWMELAKRKSMAWSDKTMD